MLAARNNNRYKKNLYRTNNALTTNTQSATTCMPSTFVCLHTCVAKCHLDKKTRRAEQLLGDRGQFEYMAFG